MSDHVLDLVLVAVSRNRVVDGGTQASSTLGEIGIDSMDLIEVMLDLEEAFPSVELDTYEPTPDTTIQQIADTIRGKLGC